MKPKAIQTSFLPAAGTLLAALARPKNKGACDGPDPLEAFSSQKVPGFAIELYLGRLVQLGRMTDEAIVVSLIYLDRVQQLTQVGITEHQIHR